MSLGGIFISLFELEIFDTGGESCRRFAILLPRVESGKLFLLSSIPLSWSLKRCLLPPWSFLVYEVATKQKMAKITSITNKTLPTAIDSGSHRAFPSSWLAAMVHNWKKSCLRNNLWTTNHDESSFIVIIHGKSYYFPGGGEGAEKM